MPFTPSEMQKAAQNPQTSLETLIEIVEHPNFYDWITEDSLEHMARNMQANADILEAMIVRAEDEDEEDVPIGVLIAVAQHPSTSQSLLMALAFHLNTNSQVLIAMAKRRVVAPEILKVIIGHDGVNQAVLIEVVQNLQADLEVLRLAATRLEREEAALEVLNVIAQYRPEAHATAILAAVERYHPEDYSAVLTVMQESQSSFMRPSVSLLYDYYSADPLTDTSTSTPSAICTPEHSEASDSDDEIIKFKSCQTPKF